MFGIPLIPVPRCHVHMHGSHLDTSCIFISAQRSRQDWFTSMMAEGQVLPFILWVSTLNQLHLSRYMYLLSLYGKRLTVLILVFQNIQINVMGNWHTVYITFYLQNVLLEERIIIVIVKQSWLSMEKNYFDSLDIKQADFVLACVYSITSKGKSESDVKMC